MANTANSIDSTIKKLNQSRAKLYEEINSGRLKTFKVGRRRYISDEAIDQYIHDREAEEAAAA